MFCTIEKIFLQICSHLYGLFRVRIIPKWITDRKPMPGDSIFAVVEINGEEYFYMDIVNNDGSLVYDGKSARRKWNSNSVVRWMYMRDAVGVFGEVLDG